MWFKCEISSGFNIIIDSGMEYYVSSNIFVIFNINYI